MSGFPDGALTSNYGLCAETVITEIRRRPFYSREKDGWDYSPETVHFKILEVGRHEYRCQYLDWEDNDWFYWPCWTEQPHYGFWIDQCSQVRYYADTALTDRLKDSDLQIL